MNKVVTNILIFTAGAAVGGVASWKLLEAKYKKIAESEIQSVIDSYARTYGEDDTDETSVEPEDEEDTSEYEAILDNEGYRREEEMPHMNNGELPYVISPDDFDDHPDGYEEISLNYYTDGILADDYGNIVDDVENTVGIDFFSHFGEYEDDTVYVRNDARRCDYEICMEYRSYKDVWDYMEVESNDLGEEDEE